MSEEVSVESSMSADYLKSTLLQVVDHVTVASQQAVGYLGAASVQTVGYLSVASRQAIEFLQAVRAMEKIRVILFVTWVWAWVGLKITKMFELAFRLVLAMPNNWLKIPQGDITNTAGKKISILNAYSESGDDITNKLRLFLRWYWEKGGDASAHDSNGFDFKYLAKMVNCSMLYCSYILADADGKIDPNTFWRDIHRFIIEQDAEGKCYRYTKPDLSDKQTLFLRHVDFDDSDAERTNLVSDIVSKIETMNKIKSPTTIRPRTFKNYDSKFESDLE